MPEAVYGPGKTPQDCVRIVTELLQHGTGAVLLTRTTAAQRAACGGITAPTTAHTITGKVRSTVAGTVADGVVELGGCLLWREPADQLDCRVVVVTAGTSDRPVADEVIATLRAGGIVGELVVDVGVAGLHRLLAKLDVITAADAVIVIAGMEGALASVIGGLTGAPVVAVPTSVGYGSALQGVTALLAMHASCASGVTVVGIDNGFGAASAVIRIVRSRDA